MNDGHIILQSESTEPELIAVPGGQACVFSSPSPVKVTPNEDSALAMPVGESAALLAVADGMGGESHGEVASRLTVESLQAEVAALDGFEGMLRTAVIDGIERASKAVQENAAGAGTTLAAAEISKNSVRTYNIGDSVVLIVGGRGKIKRQTLAHSPVGYGVESGLLDEGEAMHHDERHVISNYIGATDMRIDIGSPMALARRDTVLLASDGLFDNLHVEEVVQLIHRGPLQKAVSQLAALARSRMENPTDGYPSKPDDLTIVAFRRSS